MAGSSAGYHESEDKLSAGTMDRHRAIVSLMEELEAADWYDQRIDAAGDQELKEILRHNRDEEKEHAAMLLEWIRRRDPEWDKKLRQKLFTEGNIAAIAEVEGEPTGQTPTPPSSLDGSLGIKSMRGESA